MGTLLAAKGAPKLNGCLVADEEVPAAEQFREQGSRVQEQLRIHRQILYDLALHYLEPLNGSFSRLAYLASLKKLSAPTYEHDPLAAVYGPQPVNEPLANCHEELFERLLEMPMAQQEEDLQQLVGTLPQRTQERIA